MHDEKSQLTARFTDVSLGCLRTLEQGPLDSEAVVLVHGFGGDAENWRFNLNTLSRRHRVIAVDLPGHGESTKAVGSGSPSMLIDAVDEVLERRHISNAHFVGHSLGGLVAAGVALRRPERCRSLALVAPAGFGQAPNGQYVQGFVEAETEDEMRRVLELLFADRALVTVEFARQVLSARNRSSLELITRHVVALGDEVVVDVDALRGSNIRTMVMWGTDDRVIEPPASSMLHESIPVTFFDGVGHSPHVEASRRVNQALTDFFAV